MELMKAFQYKKSLMMSFMDLDKLLQDMPSTSYSY